MDAYFQQYGIVLLLVIVSVVVPSTLLLVWALFGKLGVRPRRPNAVKLDTYESGMTTIGEPVWHGFNVRYYMYAIIFVLFDVIAIFLYPWAVQFGTLGLSALLAMGAFLGIMTVAYVYAWSKKYLQLHEEGL